MKNVLYVAEPGAYVRQHHARLRVTKGDTVLTEVRLKDVERVVLLSGTAGITGPATTCLLENGIDAAFVGWNGELRGCLTGVASLGVEKRLAQYAVFNDPARRLELARRIVVRKIRNSDALLGRFGRNHPTVELRRERTRLKAAAGAVANATSIEALFGYEGDAAAAYFAAYGRILPEPFRFTLRTRRPPRDPSNALLSYGYALLASEATGAIAAAGLDPGLGMLHAPDSGRASLALDLMEEFRAPVVDRLVLYLTNCRILEAKTDFEQQGEGFRMLPPARRKFMEAYEKRMQEPAQDAPEGLRARLHRQASALTRALQKGTCYRGFALR